MTIEDKLLMLDFKIEPRYVSESPKNPKQSFANIVGFYLSRGHILKHPLSRSYEPTNLRYIQYNDSNFEKNFILDIASQEKKISELGQYLLSPQRETLFKKFVKKYFKLIDKKTQDIIQLYQTLPNFGNNNELILQNKNNKYDRYLFSMTPNEKKVRIKKEIITDLSLFLTYLLEKEIKLT